jgi:hypothetical protein
MNDNSEIQQPTAKPRLMLAIGVFNDEKKATNLVEKLVAEDFPQDRISLLHKSGGSGDDMLGITFTDTSERMKVWGEHGAFWGVVWGLLAGASGLFVVPGVGPLLAVGPIVDALAAAVAGATLAGGAMAGAAALTQLAAALHRVGIPGESLQEIHQAIEKGAFVVILHCGPDESDQCMMKIRWAGADQDYLLPVAK